MDNIKRIMVIDDDNNIVNLVKMYLTKEGYKVQTCSNGQEAVDNWKDDAFDLVLLDIMMPVMDGWSVLREIRKTSSVPIIMISAKGEVFDKVLGLELGADDYIVKPFDPKEMIARVKAVLRRTNQVVQKSELAEYEQLSVNIGDYTVTFKGENISLPPKELELLFFLANNPNQVYTREQLLEHVWGFDFFGDSRTVDVHIKRLREKFMDDSLNWSIKTVWGVGYKFEVK